MLQRLRWITLLHWTAGAVIVLITLFYWYIAPLPGGLAQIVTLGLTVYAYNGAAVLTIRHWRRTRFMPMPRLYSLLLNALAVADFIVLVVGIHFGGGADAPALSFYVAPMVVYGAFLPRRDAYLHASLAAALLGFVFAAESIGWLRHLCPPVPGYQCNMGAIAVVMSRYVDVVGLAFLFAYLTSFVGQHLREQEERSRQMAEQRGRLAEVRANFVTAASHEFRTPLAVILAASSMLKRYQERMTGAQRLERLTRIEDEVKHMTELLEDALTLGESEDGKVACVRDTIDLCGLCEEVVAEIRATAPATARLTFSSANGGCHAAVDPKLVRQILRNLLGNAIKYSRGNGTAHLQMSCEQDAVVFRVSDDGLGIPAQDQSHLFEPFHRGSNVGTIAGSGLGLVITKRAVDRLGGTITVESTVGTGTTFVVKLPAPGHAETAASASAACH